MAEPIRDAASATTYRGFSAVDAQRVGRAPAAPSRRTSALPLALGAVAVSAGLAWFLTGADKTPKLGASPAAAPITLRAEPVLAPVASAERILPVERITDPVAQAPAPRPVVVRKRPPVRRPAPALRATSAAPTGRPLFHCDWRLRRSERMVCGDARLTQLDRQLNHAYAAAVRSGIPREPLRRAQDAWVLRRETAARSPNALAAYYQQRIRALEVMTRGPRRRHG